MAWTEFGKTFKNLYEDTSTRLGDSSNVTWPLALIKDFINQEYVDMQDNMNRFGDWYNASTTISVSAGTQEYDLPADFDSMRKVYRADSYIELKQGKYDDYLRQGTEIQTGYSYSYYIRGGCMTDNTTTTYNLLGLVPSPSTSFSLHIDYQKKPHQLTNDNDVPLIPATFSEVLIYGAMRRARMMKGSIQELQILVPEYERKVRKFQRWLAENRERFGNSPLQDMWARLI